MLPSHTSIGCYPIVYLTKRDETLCADCADISHEPHIHWEGDDIACNNCDALLESAYGDPDVG
jgi:hypothetical protein